MFNVSINAIQNSLSKQAIISENVANLNTKGYQEIDLNNKNATYIQTSKSSPNNVNLANQLVYSNINVIDLKANVDVLKSQNKMLGYLLDINI
jgi:flagellar basal body rod protein FlgB